MSSPEKEVNTDNLAGHAPATKVGGMRVRTRSKGESSGEKEKLSSEELKRQEEEYGTEVVEKTAGTILQGMEIKDKKVFTPEAVKSYHDKPHPSHEKPTKPVKHFIQQP